MNLVTTIQTYLKPSGADSSTIEPQQLAFVEAGVVLPVLAYRQERGHIIATLDGAKFNLRALHPSGKNTWWIFDGAVSDPSGFGAKNQPRDVAVSRPRDRGVPFRLPGFTQTFHSGDPVTAKAPNFTWAEALHFSGNSFRRPPSAAVVKRIMISADAMQEVRALLDGPDIYINSWYRDPATNARVGGASQSRHCAGDGVDFRVQGLRPDQVYAKLNSWWGNRGGLASSSVFTHIDVRGHQARWSYGF